MPGSGHCGTPFVVGTLEAVGRALAAYRDKRLTHLSLNFHQPGTDTNVVRRSMEMFARELMPSVKTW